MSGHEQFPGVTYYTHVDVQPGGINIQNVEHLYQADILKGLGIELEVKKKDKRASGEMPEDDRLARAIEKCQAFFWGESSMAVIFCVCRDCFGYANNMSQFEREFHCTEGLLSNTFRNNPYMRLHIDKWKQNGAKERVLRLVEEYRKAVEEAAAGQIPTE